jgi:hypothetical protein
MPYMKLESDKAKFIKQHPVYHKGGSIPYHSLNNKQLYLVKGYTNTSGGFLGLDLGNIVKTISDNKDLIQSGVSAVSNVANAVTGISDAFKTSKELEAEKMKDIRSKRKKKEVELTPEQMGVLKKMGEGFLKF